MSAVISDIPSVNAVATRMRSNGSRCKSGRVSSVLMCLRLMGSNLISDRPISLKKRSTPPLKTSFPVPISIASSQADAMLTYFAFPESAIIRKVLSENFFYRQKSIEQRVSKRYFITCTPQILPSVRRSRPTPRFFLSYNQTLIQ